MSVQDKNIAWFLPRPKKDHYKGGMPLYCEEWLIKLGRSMTRQDADILQLFCGMGTIGYRVDIKPEVNPDLVADAHSFVTKIGKRKFDIILADPPYSTEESKELYGTGKLNYSKWTKEADKVLRKGGLLIVYHKLIPANPNPEKYVVEKRVFIGNRTWHLPRIAVFFRKK